MMGGKSRCVVSAVDVVKRVGMETASAVGGKVQGDHHGCGSSKEKHARAAQEALQEQTERVAVHRLTVARIWADSLAHSFQVLERPVRRADQRVNHAAPRWA
jgi:hypothetical protein